jgi:hypothetical protein
MSEIGGTSLQWRECKKHINYLCHEGNCDCHRNPPLPPHLRGTCFDQSHANYAASALYRRVRNLLVQVAASGVETDDARLDYVVIQIDRDVWADIQADFTPTQKLCDDSNASNDEARERQTHPTTEKPNPESFRGHTGGE